MRKTILLAAVACAFSAPAASARHIKLEAGAHDGAVRFLTSLHVNLEEGKRTSWVTITRTGNFTDPRYGKFSITRDMLLAMVSNFDKRAYGQDIFIDVSHKPDNGAAGKITKLTVEGDRLRALVEWTEFGVSAIRERGFVYLSAEYHENFKDNEKGERHGPVLLGAGLTVRPVIKGLDPIQLSEDVGNVPTLLHPELQTQLLSEIQIMWKELIKTLTEQLKGFKLGDAVVEQIIKAAEIAVGKTTDETVARALCASFGDAGKKLAEEIA
ncbi:MAG: phage protease [Burkholderiales bacterium]|nr:phage protease [Burkholderiales bacterium]